ncbi:BPSL1445 family SYLF domain-containing lipoprotein [Burkholderia lata]|uniref:Putative lipoprotein n=1 Tax=Burkholderia lata (strain ATCC 17760 / DSM 23089 / LMG 22485 / NCIMB 9086 / R18194 / 383) TaxID=482957 RepID=A0A6P2PWJ5_BURL3|nr:YSC84-related protein [Burkholderia lata]VWB43861.1 putative lipoprotein [Burkholderia lata]VWC13407.1 putative lipoprotein [Burkholderia lata]
MQKTFAMKAAAAVLLGSLALAGCTTTPDKPENASTSASKRQSIDASVNATLSRLYSTVPGSRELVAKSRGTLVFPNVLQAGFIVGGQSGNGALRVGGSTVGYYNTSSLSVGLQAGAQSKAIVFLFMTQDALDSFRKSEGWAAGADASVAVVKVGANGAVDTTTATAPVEVLVLTNAGLMGDLSVNGTKVTKLNI